MCEDIEDGVEYVIRAQLVDPNRVCIAGISFGGYAALIGALNLNKLYRCAISMNGITHLPKQIEHTAELIEELPWALKRSYESYGHPEKDKAFLEAQSPALRATEVTVPILLISGNSDPVVPFEQQELMRDALESAKKKYQFIELNDTAYNPFRNRDNIDYVYSQVEKFLANNLR